MKKTMKDKECKKCKQKYYLYIDALECCKEEKDKKFNEKK